MRRNSRTIITSILLSATVALGVSACSSGEQQLPPVIVDISTIDGTTVSVPNGGAVDLTGDETTYTAWTAEIADPAVVSFSPGKDEGGASFNPGLKALSEGTTEVTLNNSKTDETATFTVEVTKKADSGY